MNQIGRRIYFAKATGEFILDTGERTSTEELIRSTVDDDFELHIKLSDYNREALDYVELEYGEYKHDFSKGLQFTVNPETKKLIFSKPEENTVTPIDERLDNIENSILELAMLMTGGSA